MLGTTGEALRHAPIYLLLKHVRSKKGKCGCAGMPGPAEGRPGDSHTFLKTWLRAAAQACLGICTEEGLSGAQLLPEWSGGELPHGKAGAGLARRRSRPRGRRPPGGDDWESGLQHPLGLPLGR